ncbi:MAG: TIGR00375 family protein [Methanobacteriaceae archaeon]|nr:TIGR00375 family protein [Methanobacteriaceae archaeon]
MIINADLHVHSKFSLATSKNMTPDIMAPESEKKGLDLIATGDALHKTWQNILEEELEETEEGIYKLKDKYPKTKTQFIITTEVEDNQRIHHLLLIPNLETAKELREILNTPKTDTNGRPRLDMNGEEIINLAHEYDCTVGPAHIFTPWTGIYKTYDSIKDCYNKKPDFVELGLSADSNMADTIKELQDYTFLTNSDSHSPWPHRIGREFNKIDVKKITYSNLQKSIKENKIIGNYGFDPRMGKYHETGCIKCKKIYTIQEAKKRDMKCSCSGIIKKGVNGRIQELASWPLPQHPKKRPKYTYLLPLAELISSTYNKGVTTKFVQTRWENLINEYHTEINVLLKVHIDELKKKDETLAKIIESYRKNKLKVTPGRGGEYGKVDY